MGRPPLGQFAMSAAERQRRRRAGLAGKDSEPARPPTKVERLGRELARLTQQNEALRRRVNASQAVPFDLEDAPERVGRTLGARVSLRAALKIAEAMLDTARRRERKPRAQA